jgi:hypothetical protein
VDENAFDLKGLIQQAARFSETEEMNSMMN